MLGEALQVCDGFVDIVESNFVPRLTGRLQPWLTRRGLYFDHYVEPALSAQLNNLVLFNVNGRRSVLDLARISGAPFTKVRDYLERFVEAGLMERLPAPLPAGEERVGGIS
jgi:aminopeptidase-like protein